MHDSCYKQASRAFAFLPSFFSDVKTTKKGHQGQPSRVMLRFHFCYTKVGRALDIGGDKKWKCYQYKLLLSMKEADRWGNLGFSPRFFPGLEASDFSPLIRILETTLPCSASCWLYNLLRGYDFEVEFFKSLILFQTPTFANYEQSCLQKLPNTIACLCSIVSHPWFIQRVFVDYLMCFTRVPRLAPRVNCM